MRTRRAVDDTEQVELLDDRDWTGATAVTTTTRRRRWPEALLVVAALAVVAGIGAAGDDGDDASDMPRTTSTTVRRSTTTTRPRPTTTTTTWPAQVAGAGPVLGADAGTTRTALVIGEEDGTVAVLDLDTGDLCRVRAGVGGWYPSQQPAALDEAIVMDDGGRSLRVDRGCNLEPSGGLEPWSFHAQTEDTYWVTEDGPAVRLVEHARADDSTLRVFDLPTYSGVWADDRWLVVSPAGEMIAIDLRSDRTVGLGTGQPLAIGGGTLVATRCEVFDCRAIAIDVETGRARTLDIPVPTPWEMPAVSPDGRWLLYPTAAGQEIDMVLADLVSGEHRPSPRGGPCGFTADSRWLLCVRPTVVEAIDPATGRIVDLTDLFDVPTMGFTTIRTS